MKHDGITLGIDPGTARLGYGLIRGGLHPKLIDAGVIETWPDEPMPQRLVTLYESTVELIAEFHPDALAIKHPCGRIRPERDKARHRRLR